MGQPPRGTVWSLLRRLGIGNTMRPFHFWVFIQRNPNAFLKRYRRPHAHCSPIPDSQDTDGRGDGEGDGTRWGSTQPLRGGGLTACDDTDRPGEHCDGKSNESEGVQRTDRSPVGGPGGEAHTGEGRRVPSSSAGAGQWSCALGRGHVCGQGPGLGPEAARGPGRQRPAADGPFPNAHAGRAASGLRDAPPRTPRRT